MARISLRWKLLAGVCGLLFAVSGVQFWLTYAHVRRAAEATAIGKLPPLLDEFEKSLLGETKVFGARAQREADQAAVTAADSAPTPVRLAAAFAAVRALAPNDSDLISVQLLSITGTPIGADVAGMPSLSADELIRAARATAGAVGSFRGHAGNLLVPSLGRIHSGDHALGYLVEWRQIRGNPNARTVMATLLGYNAVLYFGSAGGAWTDQVTLASPPPVDVATMKGAVHYDRPGTGEVLASARAVTGTPWEIVLEFPEAVVLAPAQAFLRQGIWVTVLLLVAGVVVAMLVAHRMTGPLEELTVAADALAAGERTVRVHPHSEDEAGRLAIAFNRMADRIHEEETARMASEEQWRRLFDTNPHPMWVYAVGTLRILAVNQAAINHYGWTRDEFLGLTLRDLRAPEDIPSLEAHLAEVRLDEDDTSTWHHRTKDGGAIEVEMSSHTLQFDGLPARVVLAQDVTERRALEAQLRQAQKMEAIGRLAGGMAHDFNNILAVVTSLADLIRMDLPEGHRATIDLDTITRAAEQGHRLTRQLLAFSRKQMLQPIVIDANAAVSEAEQMLRRTLGEDVEITARLTPGVGAVRADPGQLHQVLLNLAVNARDAMPRGGRLTLSTARVEVDESSRQLHGLDHTGSFVVISVTDNGSGMTADVRARIFEPFFTTKELGKGTGLGLAMVYGIVTQSGGSLSVYSEPGRGSTFRIYLPLAEGVTAPVATKATLAAPRGGETILLVEDDPLVRGATTEALTRLGYAPVVADHPHEALRLMGARDGAPIDMVLSDVVMPRMDGPTLIGRLREMQPGLKAILMSGYPGTAIDEAAGLGDVLFLEKPFSVAALARAVRETLDRVES
ncbi:MAG TPA: ATP-binding protein [Gemmatimonadales bacterium]